MIELWRPAVSYPGYEASDHRQIRSIDRVTCDGRRIRGRVMWQFRPARHKSLYVCLSVDGVKYSVRVDDLVLDAWGELANAVGQSEAAA